MFVNNRHYRSVWSSDCSSYIEIIDQTCLPFKFNIVKLDTVEKVVDAIALMRVRGAPLIGATAAYGIAIAMLENQSDTYLAIASAQLIAARPTAVNLAWAVNRMQTTLHQAEPAQRTMLAWQEANRIADEDVLQNQKIGQHGLALLKQLQKDTVNVLTHCNAGWLATVDFGTALAPIYAAHDAGLNVHVWVDETRPRNQGASLTAWELAQHGVPHTVITDNAGGHLMQQGQVDLVIVGADRVTADGDVCNKIGTYLKALAAFDNQVPFYAAVPSPTIDHDISNGAAITIEERGQDEVAFIQGVDDTGQVRTVRIMPQDSMAANPAFDVTPARLVKGIITEQGIFAPNQLP